MFLPQYGNPRNPEGFTRALKGFVWNFRMSGLDLGRLQKDLEGFCTVLCGKASLVTQHQPHDSKKKTTEIL